jgi:dolichol-phosphate mannosyltransferase
MSSLPASTHVQPVAQTLVVVPTLEEAENITRILGDIRTELPDADILVVDDGSLDGTPEQAEEMASRLGQITVLRRTGPRGLGPAYRAGFASGLAQGYEVLVQMDADRSHDPRDLVALVRAVLGGADLAIGSRYVPGGATPGWPARRRLLSRMGGAYARRLLHLGVHDVTSGYRAYRADLLRSIDLAAVDATGFGFQIEMTERSERVGATIREVPIVFRDRTVGRSKMSADIIREALVAVTRLAVQRRFHPVPSTGAPWARGAELASVSSGVEEHR